LNRQKRLPVHVGEIISGPTGRLDHPGNSPLYSPAVEKNLAPPSSFLSVL
jgi:hypothetical protein